ncbi:MAG: heparan-alpha-glucosaminide N-acetyltransferase domain-containing protein [bacterium]
MEQKKERILFIDLMRALAVLLMVQGHTIHTLLGSEYRTLDSVFFYSWHTIRGFTAPIFMFTAGLAFTYLLRENKQPVKGNVRIKKGLKRVGILLGIGYLLRFPTYDIFNFSDVTYAQWQTFFTVDALHLIGMGLLFVIGLVYLGEKLKLTDNVIFTFGALFFFLFAPSVLSSNLYTHFPGPIAAYFTERGGSLFPLFPWAGYVISGAILGSFIANNKTFAKTKVFSYNLIFIGSLAISLSAIISQLNIHGAIKDAYWVEITKLILLRVGVVTALYGIASILEKKITYLPKIVRQMGSNTLLIYVAHLIILYGCAWFPGIYSVAGERLNAFASVSAALIMITLMILMVIFTGKYKLYRKHASQ